MMCFMTTTCDRCGQEAEEVELTRYTGQLCSACWDIEMEKRCWSCERESDDLQDFEIKNKREVFAIYPSRCPECRAELRQDHDRIKATYQRNRIIQREAPNVLQIPWPRSGDYSAATVEKFKTHELIDDADALGQELFGNETWFSRLIARIRFW